MPDNQELKDVIRLQQCVSVVMAICATFGEPMLLDAVAFVTSDEGRQAKELTSARARELLQNIEASRAINEADQPVTDSPVEATP